MEQTHRIIAIALFFIVYNFGVSFSILDPERPIFVISPENVYVTEGETAVLQCEIENLNDSSHYFGTWYGFSKIGHNILTRGDLSLSNDPRVRILSPKTNSWQLSISDIVLQDDGDYVCVVQRWPYHWMKQYRILNVVAKPKKLNNNHNETISSQLDVPSNVFGPGMEISTQLQTNENTKTATERLKQLINSTTSESFPKTSLANKSTTKPRIIMTDVSQTLVYEESTDNTETGSKYSLSNQLSHIIRNASATESHTETESSIATVEQERKANDTTTRSAKNSAAHSIETTSTKESEKTTDETNFHSNEISSDRSSPNLHTEKSNETTFTKESKNDETKSQSDVTIAVNNNSSIDTQSTSKESGKATESTSVDPTVTSVNTQFSEHMESKPTSTSQESNSGNAVTKVQPTVNIKQNQRQALSTSFAAGVNNIIVVTKGRSIATLAMDGKFSSSGPDLSVSASLMSTEGTIREVTDKQAKGPFTQNPPSSNLNLVVTAISLSCTVAIVIALIGYIVHNHKKRIKTQCKDEQEIYLL